MKNNKKMWGLVSLVVLITIAVSLGTMKSHSQQDPPKKQDKNGFQDRKKYPVVDYDAPELKNAENGEERKIKNKRYDVSLPVLKDLPPEAVAIGGTHIEPLSPAIPFAESNLIIIGKILTSEAFLSNNKKGVYSEYSVQIQTILKNDKQEKLQIGETIIIDRAGGIVRYPNGQEILYQIDLQDLPEPNGRYLFFLKKDDNQNPNYKILTGYELENEKVTALDNHSRYLEFNGMNETDFINLVLKNNRR